MQNSNNTSWGKVATWYDRTVGSAGHYYHERVIFPKIKSLIQPQVSDRVLDIGCGQGVYARLLSANINYTGIDLSRELITKAKDMDKAKNHEYYVADATMPLPVAGDSYDYSVSILALQNMKNANAAIAEMAKALKVGGTMAIVLNHPAFRVPRQSSWEVDEHNQIEYRRINRYMSELEIPINAHPGLKQSPVTWSYHQPLSYYTTAITESGCLITGVHEWVSDKESQGKAKKRENRARSEFPLFIAITAKKVDL